jgi:hypothetical protein
VRVVGVVLIALKPDVFGRGHQADWAVRGAAADDGVTGVGTGHPDREAVAVEGGEVGGDRALALRACLAAYYDLEECHGDFLL